MKPKVALVRGDEVVLHGRRRRVELDTAVAAAAAEEGLYLREMLCLPLRLALALFVVRDAHLVENAVRDRVCDGGQALRPLQRRIARDWTKVCISLVEALDGTPFQSAG